MQLLVLVRFLCFVALIYLGLQIIFARLISKPDSKVLWFFSVLTLPLVWPVRRWIAPNASEPRLRLTALIVYGLLWLIVLLVTDRVAKN
jgi:hypothetical protein